MGSNILLYSREAYGFLLGYIHLFVPINLQKPFNGISIERGY